MAPPSSTTSVSDSGCLPLSISLLLSSSDTGSYTCSLDRSHSGLSVAPSISNRVVGNHETAYRVRTIKRLIQQMTNAYIDIIARGSFEITIVRRSPFLFSFVIPSTTS